MCEKPHTSFHMKASSADAKKVGQGRLSQFSIKPSKMRELAAKCRY